MCAARFNEGSACREGPARKRRVRRVLLAILLLPLILVVATVTRVDWRPLPHSPVELVSHALGDGDGAASESLVVRGPLRAGFGRVSLGARLGATIDAPEKGEFVHMPLAGYEARRGQPAAGFHDELWAKAIAFAAAGRTGVVVSADLLIIPRKVAETATEKIESRTGVSSAQVYYGATHTHSGPGGWGEGFVGEIFAGPFNPRVVVWLADCLANAATAALADLEPAASADAAFDAKEWVRNRLVGDAGGLDSEFSLLWIRQQDGDHAVIGSFAAHPTVLSHRFMEFSGDYPGVWQREVEAGIGGMALFMAGAVGSHAPVPRADEWEGALSMGQQLARETLQLRGHLSYSETADFVCSTVDLPLPELQVRITDGWRIRPWLARLLLPVGSATRVQVLRLNDTLWLSTPCDYSGELALELKEFARTLERRVAVTSFNGDYVGYVVPSKYYPLKTYETRTMSFFGPRFPDYVDAALRTMVGIAGVDGAFTNAVGRR